MEQITVDVYVYLLYIYVNVKWKLNWNEIKILQLVFGCLPHLNVFETNEKPAVLRTQGELFRISYKFRK